MMNTLRKKISNVFLRGSGGIPDTEQNYPRGYSIDSGYHSRNQSIPENEPPEMKSITDVMGFLSTFETFSSTVRKRLYKGVIDHEPAQDVPQTTLIEPQELSTPTKHESLSRRVARSLGPSSRKKSRTSRSLQRQQGDDESPGSPTKPFRVSTDAPPIIRTSIPSGCFSTRTIEMVPERMSTPNLPAASALPQTPINDGHAKVKEDLGNQADTSVSVAVVEKREQPFPAGPDSTQNEAFATKLVEQANNDKPETVAKTLWPEKIPGLNVTSQTEGENITHPPVVGMMDFTDYDVQVQDSSDDKGYAPGTDSNTEDPGSERVSPFKPLSESSRTAAALWHSKRLSEAKLRMDNKPMVGEEGDVEPSNSHFGGLGSESDLPKLDRKPSINPLPPGKSKSMDHMPGVEQASSTKAIPKRITSEMYEADGEASEANPEVPSMWSRDEWQRTRADRQRRYLALLAHDDSTDTDEDSMSEHQLMSHEFRDACAHGTDPLQPLLDRESLDTESEPDSILLNQAIEMIKCHRASMSSSGKPIGPLSYSVEAIERQNGQDLDQSGLTVSQWLSAPFCGAKYATHRSPLSSMDDSTTTTLRMSDSEEFDPTSPNVKFDIASELASIASNANEVSMVEVGQEDDHLKKAWKAALSGLVDNAKADAQEIKSKASSESATSDSLNVNITKPFQFEQDQAESNTSHVEVVEKSPGMEPHHKFLVKHFESDTRDPSYRSSSPEVEALAKREKKEVCFADDIETIESEALARREKKEVCFADDVEIISPQSTSRYSSSNYDDENTAMNKPDKDTKISPSKTEVHWEETPPRRRSRAIQAALEEAFYKAQSL